MVNTNFNLNKERLIKGNLVSISKSAISGKNINKITDAIYKHNSDIFKRSSSEKILTYSPASLNKIRSINTNSATSTTTRLKQIPNYLAAKMAGLNVNANGSPMIDSSSEYLAWQSALNTIKGDHANLSYKSEYCYNQNRDNYTGNPKKSCAAYAFATALSIKYGQKITPDDVKANANGEIDEPKYEYDSSILVWKAGDKVGYRIGGEESDILFAIDAQLQLGNPALIHVVDKTTKDQHWATVIGKENGEYTIIDPWNGKQRPLSQMEIYCNGNSYIKDCVILTNEY